MMAIKEKVPGRIREWFIQYVHSFKNGNETDRFNIDLKEDHTFRVCREILDIGKTLGLNDDELRLAEISALLHDVGRFEQYAQYKTFADYQSVNHAALGIKILKEHDVLKELDDAAGKLVLKAIENHNKASLPSGEKHPGLFFMKLLRDADKLDIWKVVTDYYHRKEGTRNKTIELELPDTPGFSNSVIEDLIHQRIVQSNHIRNLNDFKLLQIGWIFDVNFVPTLNCIRTRRYLEMIRDVFPETPEIIEIFNGIEKYLNDASTGNQGK